MILSKLIDMYISKKVFKYCEENFLQEIDTNNICINDIVLRNKNCHYNSYHQMLTLKNPQVKVICWSMREAFVHYINKTQKGNYSDITLGLAGFQHYHYYIVEELPVEENNGYYKNMANELYKFKYDILRKISPNKFVYHLLKWYGQHIREVL